MDLTVSGRRFYAPFRRLRGRWSEAKSEPMTLVHRRVQSLEKSPLPPLSKGEREAQGDLSQQIMWTNLV